MGRILNTVMVVLCIIYSFSCKAQDDQQGQSQSGSNNIPVDLKGIVDAIEKGSTVESSHIGEGGVPSKQWEKYEQLKKVANADQLIPLTNHKSPAVRCYAFQALAAKSSGKVFNVLLAHLTDTSKVKTQSGCILSNEFVGDYFIEVVTPRRIENDIYKLTSKERAVLDSILLNDKSIRLAERSTVLRNLKPTPNNYYRIRELVKDDRNLSALMTLTKYQSQDDKELIASFFHEDDSQYAALHAVREFPDSYFFPFVVKVFEKEWEQEYYDYPKWRMCFQALAKYPRPETLQLFNKTVRTKDEFKYDTLCKYLLIAITKYPNKLYEPVRQKIKLDEFDLAEVKDELERLN